MITKKWCIFGLILSLGMGLYAVPAFSDTTSTEATISATVDGCGDGNIDLGESCDGADLNSATCSSVGDFNAGTLSCSASCTYITTACSKDSVPTGCTGECSYPVISSVDETPGSTSAEITWTATDDISVASCALSYSTDIFYGSSSVVTDEGANSYASLLEGLIADTVYQYKIDCTDTSGKNTSNTGDFLTTASIADTEGPTITLIDSSVTETTCSFEWAATDTSTVSACSFLYGLDDSFGSSATVTSTYTTELSSLLPNTTYVARISCVDTIGNISTLDSGCTTLADITPPPPVTGLIATAGESLVDLTWSYIDTVSDFDHYAIRYSTESCPTTILEGTGGLTDILDVDVKSASHPGLINLTEYFYSIFIFDTSGNTSTFVCDSAIPHVSDETLFCADSIDNDIDGFIDCSDGDCSLDAACLVVAEICTDTLDNDGDGFIDCSDSDCSEHASCDTAPDSDAEICTDDIDNDFDGDIDCADIDCASHASCGGGTSSGEREICTDGLDNDIDGFIDCADTDCSAAANCIVVTPPTGGSELICNDTLDNDGDGFIDCADTDCSEEPACQLDDIACDDGLDNDGDGFIDLLDIGCTSAKDLDEYNAPESAVITTYDHSVVFLLAERTVILDESVVDISTLVGDQVTIRFIKDDASPDIDSIHAFVGSNKYAFTSVSKILHNVDFLAPAVGVYDITLEVLYETGDLELIPAVLRSLPYGVVSTKEDVVSGASVTLFVGINNEIWNATEYRQVNPQTTEANGVYGFVVPNGTYQIAITKEGYRTRNSRVFTVTNNVINESFDLLKIPETPIQTIAFLSGIVTEEVGDIIANVAEIADNPVVEGVTKNVVAPTVVGVSSAVVIPSLWSILFPLLRFMFLQPILVFSKKRRERYGIVYNSLTKMPLDLVVVRLIDSKTGRVMQSHVTNKKGQYVFIPQVGSYKIEISKQTFTFPSALLKGKSTDGKIVDIYHGEIIEVSEDGAAVAPNIPIDPIVADKTAKRMHFQKLGAIIQHIIAVSGIIITVVTLYISPVWYLWVFLAVHIILYFLFLRYTRPEKPSGWGIVYNTKNKKPLGRVVARLFSKEYNKLVATELTDTKGRYAFLAGSNDYYVTFEKEGYSDKKEEVIIKEDSVISKNIPLEPEL